MPGNVHLPGVPIQEPARGAPPIAGARTSVAAFVGLAREGPLDAPVPLASFADYERHFGGLDAGSEMGWGVRQFFANGGTDAWAVRVAAKATRPRLRARPNPDPREVARAVLGDRTTRKGLYALEAVDGFNLLVLPGIGDPATLAAAADYCRERRAFLIIDGPPGGAGAGADEMAALMAGPSLPRSEQAAVYYPWLAVADPLRNGQPRLTAPSGSIAGLYARTDAEAGVWKAPAGTRAAIRGAQGLAAMLDDGQGERLNAAGVNVIRAFPVHGIVAWGARTLRGADDMASEYKYVPVRRLALHIEESLRRGTPWAVFEPNAEPLWAQLRLAVGAFMDDLFRRGAFQGRTAREAYFVKCDAETTPRADIGQGRVTILVGFAPLKPAEFVLVRVQQQAGAPPT